MSEKMNVPGEVGLPIRLTMHKGVQQQYQKYRSSIEQEIPEVARYRADDVCFYLFEPNKTALRLPSVGANEVNFDHIYLWPEKPFIEVGTHLFVNGSPHVANGDLADGNLSDSEYSLLVGVEMPPMLVQARQGFDTDFPKSDYVDNLAKANKHLLTDKECDDLLGAMSVLGVDMESVRRNIPKTSSA